MPFADPERQPNHMSGTAIGAALRFCKQNMEAEALEGDRMIVLVSDGDSSDLSGGQSEAVGQELKDSGILLYHIHVAEDAVPPEVSDMAGVHLLGMLGARYTPW
jgi:putative NIF3 family GTP cyclohydrolase 1 type 2